MIQLKKNCSFGVKQQLLTDSKYTYTVKVLFFMGINFRGLVKNYKFVDS